MNEGHALLARIHNLERDLDRAFKPFGGKEELRAQFDRYFSGQRIALARLKQELKESPPKPTVEAWGEFKKINDGCGKLFAECLSYLAGVEVRRAGLDDGVGMLADAFLDDLSARTGISWGGVSLLGSETSYNRIVEIVRLRFPEFSVWSLPAAAHEFGHMVARKLKAATVLRDDILTTPFQDFAEEAGGGLEVSFLHELFADVFATYATGPAFLCRSVLLSFDPRRAYQHGKDHPMAAMRVELMRRTLEWMAEGWLGTAVSRVTEIDTAWTRALESAGVPSSLAERLDDTEMETLEAWWRGIVGLLEANLPQSARYRGWLAAQRLWQALEDTDRSGGLFGEIDDPPADVTQADVLNAAWLFRLNYPFAHNVRLPELERTARGWCNVCMKRANK